MEEKRGIIRSVVASLLLAAFIIATPIMLTRSDGSIEPTNITPTIELDGMQLSLDRDGNIQAYVDVYVSKTLYANSIDFYVKYDDTWMQPSDYYTNKVIDVGEGMQDMLEGAGQNNFFVYNRDMYVKTYPNGTKVYENPFSVSYKNIYYRRLNTAENLMSLTLYLDRAVGSKLYNDFQKDGVDFDISGNVVRSNSYIGEVNNAVEGGIEYTTEHFYYLASKNADAEGDIIEVTAPEHTRVKVGTLSFRIKDREALRDMVEQFNGSRYWYKNNETAKIGPLCIDTAKEEDPVDGGGGSLGGLDKPYKFAWNIWAYEELREGSNYYMAVPYAVPDKAAAQINYDFGNGLVAAELLQPEIEINAYRAYSAAGDTVAAAKENIAAALRKYSPTVVASYADARVRNFTLNWGASDVNAEGREYDFRVYAPYTGADYAELLAAVRENPTDPEYAKYLVHNDITVEYKTSTEPGAPGEGDKVTITGVEYKDNFSLWQDITTIPDYKYDPRSCNDDLSTPRLEGSFIATQYFWYDSGEVDQNDVPIYYRYPNPMEAHIRITPIHVRDVTAANLDQRYTKAMALDKDSTAKLELPTEVQILTEEVSGAAGLYLIIGDEGGELPGWKPATSEMKELVPEGYADNTKAHWPVPKSASDPDDAAELPFAGDYIFTLGEKTAGAARKVRGEEDIRAKYPWLTAEDDYDIQAVRRVKPEGSTLYSYQVRYSATTGGYPQNIPSDYDYTTDNLTLVLAVRRDQSRSDLTDANEANFSANAGFRIRLPNGKEIGLGMKDDSNEKMDDWFGTYAPGGTDNSNQDGASYTVAAGDVDFGGNTVKAETLTLVPGKTSSAAVETQYLAERAELRRWINLGGHFEISVCEDTKDDTAGWSEFMPVYVPPRTNYYEQDKEYNFLGLNAGLMDYRGRLADTITMPNGDYTPVSIHSASGTPANTFMTEALGSLVVAAKESYGVLTTYDGATGDQPGHTFTFRVKRFTDSQVWAVEKPDASITGSDLTAFGSASISRYNYDTPPTPADPAHDEMPNDFDMVAVAGYGIVQNGKIINAYDPAINYDPTLRMQEPESPELPIESLHLIYEGPPTLNIITQSHAGVDEVTDVKFDTQTEGYMVRQSFVLTLHNDGKTDIDGIYIDSLTDMLDTTDARYHSDGGGGHFEITDPPATFLAAGCRTTFTVTYVMDLKASSEGDLLEYLDKLYVCSNRSGAVNRLCEFDCHFGVTKKPVNRVTVVVLPPFTAKDGSTFYLGEAGVIGGLQTGPGDTKTMDYEYASSMRTQGEKVYIGAFPHEEYEVLAVISSNGAVVPIKSVKDAGVTPPEYWDDVWEFDMPPSDVTIYVIFYEPVSSKLRPAEINVYASGSQDDVVDRAKRDDTRKVLWQKSFTSQELTDNTHYDTSLHQNVVDDLTLMRGGRAAMKDYNAINSHYLIARDSGNGYDTVPGNAHYLVVLEQEEEWVQADLLLRKVVALSTGDADDPIPEILRNAGYIDWAKYRNLDINGIKISMDVYEFDDDNVVTITPVYSSDPVKGDDKRDFDTMGYTSDYNDGDTSVPTKHTSTMFAAPAEGDHEWLVIQLSYDETTESGTNTVTRGYYIELVRRPSYSVSMNFGNSPVGMIYNTRRFRLAADNVTILDGLNNDGKAMLELFEKNRTFASVADADLPYAFSRNNISKSLVYNKEAWIDQGLLYEPDARTSEGTYFVGYDAAGNRLVADAAGIHKTDTIPGANVGDPDTMIRYLDIDAVEDYEDLDLDPYALFVLLGTDFTDPGLSQIKDSSMRDVENSRVRRYIKDAVLLNDDPAATQLERFAGSFVAGTTMLRTENIDLGTLENSPYRAWQDWQATHQFSQATYKYFGEDYPQFYDPETWNAETNTDKTITQENPEGFNVFYFEYGGGYWECNDEHARLIDDDVIARLQPLLTDDRQSVSIRPGVYELVYEFEDFDSAIDASEPLRETRYIVVLGAIGDVNADNFVTNDSVFDKVYNALKDDEEAFKPLSSDEKLIEIRVGSQLGYDTSNYADSNVVKFRTVDVNNDRDVNNIDANTLHSAATNGKTGAEAALVIKQFYEPVNYQNLTTMSTGGGAGE